jgi:hypothetical protein
MRSVRALDVLFTAQSAVNLLTRVVTSQTGKLCQVEPRTYTHIQDANVDASSGPTSSFTSDSTHEALNGVPPAAQRVPNHGETVMHTSEPLLQEDTKSTLNLNSVSKEASTSHVGVRQRYTKPSSKLFESLEPNSLQQFPPVSALDLNRFCFSPSILQAQMIMRASKVPSSRVGRLFHYGGMLSTNNPVIV